MFVVLDHVGRLHVDRTKLPGASSYKSIAKKKVKIPEPWKIRPPPPYPPPQYDDEFMVTK